MRLAVIIALCAGLWSAAAPVSAQVAIPPTAIPPDPASIATLLNSDLQWHKESLGQLQAPLFGDPSKPGTYGVLIKWLPGQFSHPHTHSTDRWAYVLRGTWWVSTSTHRDLATTYPVQAGTFAIDYARKVHWDGAKDEEVILLVIGEGPVDSVLVPEN